MHRVDDSVGEALRADPARVDGEDRELVAAIARDHVLRAGRVAGDPRAHLQHQVAVLVAELVVDRLEVVEVDEQQ